MCDISSISQICVFKLGRFLLEKITFVLLISCPCNLPGQKAGICCDGGTGLLQCMLDAVGNYRFKLIPCVGCISQGIGTALNGRGLETDGGKLDYCPS